MTGVRDSCDRCERQLCEMTVNLPVWEIPDPPDERRVEESLGMSSDEDDNGGPPPNILYIKDNITPGSSKDPYRPPIKNWFKRRYKIDYYVPSCNGPPLILKNHWRFIGDGDLSGLGHAIEETDDDHFIWLKTPDGTISMFLYTYDNEAYYQINFVKHQNEYKIIPPIGGYVSAWNCETECIEAVIIPSFDRRPELSILSQFVYFFYLFINLFQKILHQENLSPFLSNYF